MIVDRTDDQCRAAMPLKWGIDPPDVLPAWVAEMDYELAPPVTQALLRAVADGRTSYPGRTDPELARALAGFAARQWDWQLDPSWVVPTGDVMAGLLLAVERVSGPGPVVVPTPAYMPFLDVPALTGRERIDLPLDPDAAHSGFDLDRLDGVLAAHPGATLLLTQPHNPWGRVFTRPELEGIRDVVTRRGARVISDEIHAPLVLVGRHLPYLAVEGTAGHTVTVIAASKAFNLAGLKCAQLVVPDPRARARLQDVPTLANHGNGALGAAGAIAAYTAADLWLAALVERIRAQRELFGTLLAEQLPQARVRPLEATFLAWVDARGYGPEDPARRALERGRVRVNAGPTFGPGGQGHVRVNLATSPDRLTEIVRRLALAWR